MKKREVEEEIILPDDKLLDIRMKKRFMEYEKRRYKEVEKEIKEKGFKKLREEIIEKLTLIYKEMLEYKNIKYDKEIDFLKLSDKVAIAYNIFDIEIGNTKFALTENKIYSDEHDEWDIPIIKKVSEVECIYIAEELYRILSSKKEFEGYKEYADYDVRQESDLL